MGWSRAPVTCWMRLRVRPLPVPRDRDAPYHDRPRPDVVAVAAEMGMLGVVCDIGCASGRLGADLLAMSGIEQVIGVEADPATARQAEARLTRVIMGDLADGVLDQLPYDLDGVVLADVLEHLADPLSVLMEVLAHARPGASVVISVPNARHFRVSGSLLLKNRWDYAEEGVCDRTHLRFFTSETIAELAGQAGLQVRHAYGIVVGRSTVAARIFAPATTLVATQIVLGCTKTAGPTARSTSNGEG